MKDLWIKPFKPVQDSRCRLICFPYAGGGALIFRRWHEYLFPNIRSGIKPDIEICPVKLPGRENRIREPLPDNLFLLVKKLEKEIRPFLDRPFAFFGHSMGALIAFELAKKLRNKKAPQPFHLFVSGRRAPQIKPAPPIHNLSDNQFIEKLRKYGGTPEAVFQEPQLLDLFLPILRADFALNDNYTYINEKPLKCPVTAFFGTHDKIAPKDYVSAWKEQTDSQFDLHMIKGGHFFLNEQTENMLNIIHTSINMTLKKSKGAEMKTYIFPGQGSQKKGMGESLFDEFKDITQKADKILGYSIKELCVNDPQNKLGQTNYTQPALYVVNALTWLKKASDEKPDFLAGHSLGEYNALFASGAFDFETGLKLVQERSRLMALAKGGGMAAVVGLDEEKIDQIIKENQLSGISIANYNSQDQIVISGIRDEIKKAKPVFENKGAKLYVALPVSGAFHTNQMQNAKEEFAEFIENFKFNPLNIPVISNVTAREYEDDKIKELLCKQITSPVKWSDSVRYIMGKGEMAFEETGPGRVLKGLVKKIKKMPPIRETKKEKTETSSPKKEINPSEPAARQDDKPEQKSSSILGNPQFKKEYNLKYAYITGAMANGIASKELVTAVGKAGMMGFYGTGGLDIEKVEKDIISIKEALGEKPYGMNLLHTPESPEKEEEFVDLFMKLGVKHIEAAAFMQMTPGLVKYRVSGLFKKDNGEVGSHNKVMGKVSRPELAQAFYSPAPEHIIKKLLDSGKITKEQARLSEKIPMGDALCVEADSGGHTDQRTAYALMPAILKLRGEMAEKHGYKQYVFTGAAGGIGTPEAAAASFILGADFILTGSINQCTIEADTSDIVKDMLSQMNVQDTDYAPAGDMFEIGAKVQVLKKGVFFPARANKLYNLYKQFNSIDEIDQKTKEQIQKLYFKKSFDQVYEETKEFFLKRDPKQIEKAQKNPKHKMALIFRWYFGYSNNAALHGKEEHKVNFQIHTGPALGAFNQWVKGTDLENWKNRHTADIGVKLMEETEKLLKKRMRGFES